MKVKREEQFCEFSRRVQDTIQARCNRVHVGLNDQFYEFEIEPNHNIFDIFFDCLMFAFYRLTVNKNPVYFLEGQTDEQGSWWFDLFGRGVWWKFDDLVVFVDAKSRQLFANKPELPENLFVWMKGYFLAY